MGIYDYIDNLERDEIADILDAVLFRYRQLYPEWDISLITVDKREDKNEQLDRVIQLLQNMKEK